jgi:hypothetical protein
MESSSVAKKQNHHHRGDRPDTTTHTATPTTINQVDVDRLQHLFDLIHQTQALCDVLRTLITTIKHDTVEISNKARDRLQQRIDRSKNISLRAKE